MEQDRTKEELLEVLWYMQEDADASFDRFQREVGEHYRRDLVAEMEAEGLVRVEGDSIRLTDGGRTATRQLIRSHRLAERLVHDVLGVEYERGACEFEHIVNPDLVDSICTLLGHPRECPHGLPIPEGECCRQRAQTVESSVVPLPQLEVGEAARVAYVYAGNDQQLHRLDNLLIRPGVIIKLHQRRPSFVVECEGSMIALDDTVAGGIHVWVSPERVRSITPHGRRRQGRGFGHA